VTGKLTAVQAERATAGTALAAVTGDWLGKAKEVEKALKAGNQWVSFREEVAPIFYSRCLACHNARTAKGRFNMESFASIMKGGESGADIEPGKGEESNLCTQISDGSMPQDADPLKPEQVAVIKRWVALGAKLDAGVPPSAPLIQIMPKVAQPPAPTAYPVAIPVTALAFAPDGTKLASSGYHEVILWNVADHAVAQRITNVAERIYDVAFHPDGQRIAIAAGTPGQVGEVKIFSLADGKLLADLVTVEDAMFGVAFNADGSKLAACGADRSIRVFDVASLKEDVHVEDHADWVMDIHWSPDGTKLVSASRDKTSKIFDAKTGDALATFNGHGEPVNSAVFMPDGTAVASSGRDKTVRIWSIGDTAEKQGAAAPKELRKIGGFGDDVLRVEILPDNRLFTVSADKQARSFNAADGAALKTYSGHSDWVYALAVHPATGMLATGSYDGEIRLWKIEEATTVANWTAAPGYSPQQAAAK
jgi:WD40 repeat protein